MAKTSPTQRTIRELKAEGRILDICEKWVRNPKIPGGGFRKDLFGFLDIIVLDRVDGIVGIQSCGQSWKAHVDKIMDSECTENVIEWLMCGARLELWGWRKLKLKRGGKAMRWKARVAEITVNNSGNLEIKEYK